MQNWIARVLGLGGLANGRRGLDSERWEVSAQVSKSFKSMSSLFFRFLFSGNSSMICILPYPARGPDCCIELGGSVTSDSALNSRPADPRLMK